MVDSHLAQNPRRIFPSEEVELGDLAFGHRIGSVRTRRRQTLARRYVFDTFGNDTNTRLPAHPSVKRTAPHKQPPSNCLVATLII